MKPEIAKRLVEVLEAKQHKKGTGFLAQLSDKNKWSFCCLGVLCELYDSDQRRKKKRQLSKRLVSSTEGKIIKYNSSQLHPPEVVCKWAGLSDTESNQLSDLNDYSVGWKQVIRFLKKVK